jgi:hypothetical protein
MPRFSAHDDMLLHQLAGSGMSIAEREVETRVLKFCPEWPLPSSPMLKRKVDHGPSSPSKEPLGGIMIGLTGCDMVDKCSGSLFDDMLAMYLGVLVA